MHADDMYSEGRKAARFSSRLFGSMKCKTHEPSRLGLLIDLRCRYPTCRNAPLQTFTYYSPEREGNAQD